MELKNTAWELHKAYTNFSSWINQAEERISETEDQLNEMKWEGKIREKIEKRTKPPRSIGLCLIGVPECDGENEFKLENTLQDISQGNFPNLAR